MSLQVMLGGEFITITDDGTFIKRYQSIHGEMFIEIKHHIVYFPARYYANLQVQKLQYRYRDIYYKCRIFDNRDVYVNSDLQN